MHYRIIFILALILGITSLGVFNYHHLKNLSVTKLNSIQKNTPTPSPKTSEITSNKPPFTEASELIEVINSYRKEHQIPEYIIDNFLCQIGSNLTDQTDAQSYIYQKCPKCSSAALINVTSINTKEKIHQELINDNNSMLILDNDLFTHVCGINHQDLITLVFAGYAQKPTPPPIKPKNPTSPTPTSLLNQNFSEDELIQALSIYRSAHGKHALNKNDNLCNYARERISTHVENFKNKSVSEYPNPDKYPLDAHTGFEADAQSGRLFEITKVNHVAENLAYFPTAQSPTHIIEWGWDSSTEGHRETQLSDDFDQVCISGKDGFYVAIYGK